jgi:hypothetical protein
MTTGSAEPAAPPDAAPAAPARPASKASEQLIEARSQWLNDILTQHPEVLAMRERALAITGGYSFANVTHTQIVTDSSQVNRHVILQLIAQHLEAIGLYETSEILSRESGHVFQAARDSWDRSDLRLLVSLAVGHRENPWAAPADVDHHYVEDTLDEDLLAAPYREDPARVEAALYDPAADVAYDASGQRGFAHIALCSLARLAVNLATVDDVDDAERQILFLAINSITSATHFLEHLVTLYDVAVDEARLAAAGCPKTRAECCYKIALALEKWCTKARMGKRVVELVRQFAVRAAGEQPALAGGLLLRVLEKLKNIGGSKQYEVPELQPPTVTNPLALFNLNVALFDPDAVELARQMTLMCHEKFTRIHPLEFITAMSDRRTSVRTPTLAEFFEFGDSLTLLVADAFLGADRKQHAFERILEIARNLAQLSNFDALACVVRFLRRDDVRKIVNTPIEPIDELWGRSGEKTQGKDDTRALYDAFLQKESDAGDRPVIPNMHVEIKSGRKGDRQPDYVNGLINWGKVLPHARRCALLNHFQETTYKFTVVPQIQDAIRAGAELSAAPLEEKLEELARGAGRITFGPT